MAELTIAIDCYDRYIPLLDGTAKPPAGHTLNIRQVGASTPLRDGQDRNRRMLVDGEFDICEFGVSAYLMARDQGYGITAIPVFPRRLFSQSQIFVAADSGYTQPADLAGKRIALNSFQTSLSVLALGDLKFHYGVPWEDIIWCPTSPQILEFPSDRQPTIDERCYGKRPQLGQLLESGEIDAFLLPRPPAEVVAGKARVRRLFQDPRAAEADYYRARGFFPVMHLIAMREGLEEEHPGIGRGLLEMFAEMNAITRNYYSDPAWSRLAWGMHCFEEQEQAFGEDPWPVGLKANRANIESYSGYSRDQGLTLKVPDIDALFVESVRDT